MDSESLVTGYLERVQSDCPNAVPRIDLKGPLVTMGRGIGNTVIWESLQISRRHAVMEYRNQTWKIKDTSTNGMLVNSRRIPQNLLVDLHDSDIISFVPTGALQYRFVKVNNVKHSPQNASLNASPASVTSSTSHRPNSESSVSVIVTNPGKSPKRKSGPTDLQNSERKRKRLFLNTSQQSGKHSDDEEDEELLDIDELPSFFEKAPLHSSTPSARNINNNENGLDLLSGPEGNDLETVKLQLKNCQQRLHEAETKARKDHDLVKEVARLKNEIATSRSESRVFQEELYKKIMEVLEHEFSCCICNEVFIQATVIDCGHTFCAHCISEWVKRKTECPNCRKPVKLQVRHVEMENYVVKLHTMFSEEIRTKREQILNERKHEVESIAAANEAARHNAARARGRGVVPMDLEPRFDFYADLNNLREMLVPRGIHPPNFIPQGHLGARPFTHNNILNFHFPEFMRAHPAAEPPPPPTPNPRRRSQRIQHPREPPAPRIRGRGAQQVPEVRPHIAEYVLGGGGPMDILTVD